MRGFIRTWRTCPRSDPPCRSTRFSATAWSPPFGVVDSQVSSLDRHKSPICAENGLLYGTARRKKTHMNMGNLFGWIYGDQPDEFKLETWERYVNNSKIAADEEPEE